MKNNSSGPFVLRLALLSTLISALFVINARAISNAPWCIGMDGGVYHETRGAYLRDGLATARSIAVAGYTVYVIGTDGQVWTGGGASWQPTFPGLRGSRITADVDGSLYVIGADGGVYAVRHGEVSRVGLAMASDVAAIRGTLYVIGTDGRVWKGDTAGHWAPFNLLAKGTRVAVGTDGKVFIIGMDGGVYRLTSSNIQRIGLGAGSEIAISAEGEPYIVGTDSYVWRFHHGNWERWSSAQFKGITFPRG